MASHVRTHHRGNWQGGHAQFMPVPYADFSLLKIDNKQKALDHMMDIVLLSDVLPTGTWRPNAQH